MTQTVDEADVQAQDGFASYSNRLIGRTKVQKTKEAEIRDLERGYWVAKLTRLGDGRANRHASKEERAAFRRAAAMIQQNAED